MNRHQLDTHIPIPDVVNIVLGYMSGTNIRETRYISDDKELMMYFREGNDEKAEKRMVEINTHNDTLPDEEKYKWQDISIRDKMLSKVLTRRHVWDRAYYNVADDIRTRLNIPGCPREPGKKYGLLVEDLPNRSGNYTDVY